MLLRVLRGSVGEEKGVFTRVTRRKSLFLCYLMFLFCFVLFFSPVLRPRMLDTDRSVQCCDLPF